MFAPRYFAARYFAPRYWPPSGDAIIAAIGNIIYGQSYNMIYPVHETAMRPTTVTEQSIRQRDKKPIITGGDH